jgi:hypothetical protein
MATIDLTPTREEHARITAYILASHTDQSPAFFLGGDYWNATEQQNNAVFGTWNELQTVIDALDRIGIDFYKQTKTFKKNAINSAFATVTKALAK